MSSNIVGHLLLRPSLCSVFPQLIVQRTDRRTRHPVYVFTSYGCTRRRKEQELESSWNVMAHGDARWGKWRGNWRMEWVASTLHTISEHVVSSITTADALTSAASSRLNWRPRRFKWTRPFRPKTKSGFCACAITFQTESNQRRDSRCRSTRTRC